MVALGWPFLIGRGRRTGHRVLLAPDFLVAAEEHGTLEGISGSALIRVGQLTIRSAIHQVDARDAGTPERPRDEHGRPLRLIYGVVAKGVEPANADLPNALASALATYRRFLGGEEGFNVESSQGFPLTNSSSTADQRQPEPHRPARARVAALFAGTALVATLAIGSTILLGQSAREPGPVPPPPPPSCTSTKMATPTSHGTVACGRETTTITGRKP